MKKFNVLFSGVVIVLIVACVNDTNQAHVNQDSIIEVKDADESVKQLLKQSMQGVEHIKYHEYIDQKNGLVQVRYPIPKSWTVNSMDNPVYIEGPNALKIYKAETSNYAWSQNPMMQQTLQMSGQTIAQPLNNQQILSQFVRPNAESQGYQFLKSYELPEVAGLWQRLLNAMPSTGSHRMVEALGSEWETPRGTKSFIVQVRYQLQKPQSVMWSLQTTELESDKSYFEEAKNAYLYSSANAQLNPQWIQYMNGQLQGNIQRNNDFWARASAQSAAAHQQRMDAIAARGATSKSVASTYSDILDISHKGYLNRSHINSEGHSKTIRSINETALIGNHETGEHYTVPSGSNYYWVSEDGFYIGTHNALLDPNTDDRMNDKRWTKFAAE